MSVGFDPTGTFWPRLATFDVYDQITIATRRQTSICLSCESPIRKLGCVPEEGPSLFSVPNVMYNYTISWKMNTRALVEPKSWSLLSYEL